jgi:2-polyprenyl-3-methyl-5-hydroxy-6-metoxy-1,4-benzoquinol methylase
MKYTEFNPREYEVHDIALKHIPERSYVLELGCATGYFSAELKKKGCTVVGVDYEKEALVQAKKICDRVVWADFESGEPLPVKEQFDRVLCMDVIEHLRNGQNFLRTLRPFLEDTSVIILSTPNVAHIRIRLKLLFGQFGYTKTGVMDETHVHFYTRDTLKECFERAGYDIEKIVPSADFGQLPFLGRFARHIPKSIQYTLTTLFPTLLGVQFVVLARKKV